MQSTPFRRNHLATHARLGRALAEAGALEEAVAAGDEALALLPGVNNGRINTRLKEFRDVLLERNEQEADGFSNRYEAVAT